MDGKKSIPPIENPSLQSEQELRDTIQHLAVQNMHLYTAKLRAEVLLQEAGAREQPIKCKISCNILPTGSIISPLPSTSEHSQVEERELAEMSNNEIDFHEDVNTDSCKDRNIDSCKHMNTDSYEDRVKRSKIEMDKFKEDISNRREARHKAISAVSSELERLRGELTDEKLARENCEKELRQVREQYSREGNQADLLTELARTKHELAEEKAKNEGAFLENKRLLSEKEDLSNNLKEEKLQFDQDRAYSQRRIGALKDVADLSKQMLAIRENQVTDLKTKIKNLEAMPKEGAASTQLQVEYDTQINNIKSLKLLYEDRMRILTAEKEKIQQESEEKSAEVSTLFKKCSELEQRLAEVESTRSEQEELNINLQTRLDMSLEESKSLSKEITLINNMFTQMLVGNSSSDLDLDKLTRILQENHDLITEMTTKEDGTDTANSLPKLLWDLLNQIDKDDSNTSTMVSTCADVDGQAAKVNSDESSSSAFQQQSKCVTEETANGIAVEEIASNLPKVWKVLMELLSHHVAPTPSEDLKPSCYKCIDTPTGPQFVPSVSNTYIRLKDLILEKKSLQKDLGKLKQLNGHLESKLHEQEKRLLCVSAELRKTWGVVGRLRSQFKQLHTHEQILRYELQQKRHLLTELKKELEYCREKWEMARQKDKETEIEWQKLREEFAARKLQDRKNSRESGFFDEKEVESGEDERSTRNTLPSSTDLSEETPEPAATPPSDNSPPEEQEPNTCNDYHEDTELTDISWITLVKLQSLINNFHPTEYDRIMEAKALESIFLLPPIKIPESIHRQQPEKNNTPPVNAPSTPEIISPHSELPGPSTCRTDTQVRDALGRTPEEALAARAARLKRLEEQTQLLYKKVTRTTNLSMALSNRLEELHEQYGVPNPPPLPATLPALRIPVAPSPPDPSLSPPEIAPTSLQETLPTLSILVEPSSPAPTPSPEPTPTQTTGEVEKNHESL